MCGGRGEYGKSLYLPLNFAVNPTTLKNKVNNKNKRMEKHIEENIAHSALSKCTLYLFIIFKILFQSH